LNKRARAPGWARKARCSASNARPGSAQFNQTTRGPGRHGALRTQLSETTRSPGGHGAVRAQRNQIT